TNTQKNTASPPSQSVLDNQGRDGGSGNNSSFLRTVSYSAGPSVAATTGGSASAMTRCAPSGAAAVRPARNARIARPRCARHGKDQVDHQHQHPDEPGGASAVRH